MAPAIIESKLSGLVISSIIGYNSKSYDTATVIQYICTRNNSLTLLYLRKLKLSDHDVEDICSGLNLHPDLKLLDLSCNNISDFGAGFIIKYAARNKRLRGLFLAHNRLSDDSSYSLSCILPASKIAMLDVSYNDITDRGLLCFLDILGPAPQLHILLWGNKIGHEFCAKYKALHTSGINFTGKLDVQVHVDNVYNFGFDHNPELDTFRRNYYSAFSTSDQAMYATFPFHKV
ncbi:hypothetical protein WDU94_005145 [Cyamophila willieti]